jgi:hypothetical protein
VLLTATGAAGAVIYVAWALLDGAWVRRRAAAAIPVDGDAQRPEGAREAAVPVGDLRDGGQAATSGRRSLHGAAVSS